MSPLDQAREASGQLVIDTLRAEIKHLVAALARTEAERDRIRAAACRVVDARPPIWSSVIGNEIWAAIDQLAHEVRPLTVVEPDDDELNASIARHPAGKARK